MNFCHTRCFSGVVRSLIRTVDSSEIRGFDLDGCCRVSSVRKRGERAPCGSMVAVRRRVGQDEQILLTVRAALSRALTRFTRENIVRVRPFDQPDANAIGSCVSQTFVSDAGVEVTRVRRQV